MMQARRLVDLIEKHADELTARLVAQLKENRQTAGYRRLDDLEIGRRARAIYEHLGTWLRSSSELQVEDAFFDLGRDRCREGIPLADVVAGQLLTRANLWEYVDSQMGDSAADLRGELDLQILVVRFFDRTILHTVRGYEAAMKEEAQAARR